MAYLSGKETAVLIRKELKKTFNTKFSVRSDSESVRITWAGFPTVKHVEDIVSKYRDVRKDQFGEILAGGNLYVFCSNTYPSDIKEKIKSLMPENLDTISYKYFFNVCANELYNREYRKKLLKAFN